jgi:kexin
LDFHVCATLVSRANIQRPRLWALTVDRGESGIGNWTVIVKDSHENEFNGTFIDWRLNLWGEAINAETQELHPIPNEHDDDHETASAVVSTTSVEAGAPATATAPPEKPTDHPERPTKPTASGSTDSTVLVTATKTISVPASTATETLEPTHTYSDSFLPSFFPTFGASKRTQIWIYGSLGLIVVFCAGLGSYFLVQRRRRLRNNPRDAYEFEMVGDVDDDEQQGLARKGRGKGRAKRGGELYDAFAGESDDELYSDDEAYQDTPSNDTGGESRSGSSEGKLREK